MHYLSIVAIFKQENPWLVEWIDYHQARGIEHFYLYNNDDDPDESERILRPYVQRGLVQTFPVYGELPQYQAYRHAIDTFGLQNHWMAVIDLDEFLLPGTGDDVRPILEEYEESSALVVHWNVFGSNGLIKRPPNQINHFLRRAPDHFERNGYVKSIINPRTVDTGKLFCPHAFPYHTGHAVNENHQKTDLSISKYTGSKIRINHYCVRSREDFETVKLVRGLATPSPDARDESFWQIFDRNEIYDDEISRRFGNQTNRDQ